MRFSSLTLERYGRFENCALRFRAGSPDLHVIYGANEAGKSTSLSAVSDLLFGFPSRSPYNFIFSYPLMRVGAVLEADGQTFACRRKKGTTGTLLDSDDRPLDEGPLLAMLKGQTRETFALSFSLNQAALREGGRAMVEARDDVGRALFAAGSGLTGVSDELARLEGEADEIWGARAAGRRSYTKAQRDLDEATRAVRDDALKPKTWQDARAAVDQAQTRLNDVQQRRDALLATVSQVERIRRVAPAVSLRAQHLAGLAAHDDVVEIAEAREAVAEAALAEAEIAGRAKAVAERLINEATARAALIGTDPAVLEAAAQIDALSIASGAIGKAQHDLARLQAEQAAGAVRVKRLREEAGVLDGEPPTRILGARLRDLALAYAQDQASLREIEESQGELARRLQEIVPNEGADLLPDGLERLKTALDGARALGTEADARCLALQAKADTAAAAGAEALVRLAPWRGEIDVLLQLPRPGAQEIDDVNRRLAELAAEAARETAAGQRAREEAGALELEIAQLSTGVGVSDEEIATARRERRVWWEPIRARVLAAEPLPAPKTAVDTFEAALDHADERSDLRFAAADASSRLTEMGHRRARRLLDADQAELRAGVVVEQVAAARAAWGERLTAEGQPDLDPVRLHAWISDRERVEALHAVAAQAAREASAARAGRDAARARLAACLETPADARTQDDLAPLLIHAERLLNAAESVAQQARLDEAARIQVAREAKTLDGRRSRVVEDMTARLETWRANVEAAGVALDIADAAATLDIFDELRAALAALVDLQERIDGIARDTVEHERQVAVIVASTATAGSGDGSSAVGANLDGLRQRLTAARSAAAALATVSETIYLRSEEARTEAARQAEALAALDSLFVETGAKDVVALGAAIATSRTVRKLRAQIAQAESAILSTGDGKALENLIAEVEGEDVDALAGRAATLTADLTELNAEVADCAVAHGDARRAFETLDGNSGAAIHAATRAEQARAELGDLAEHYILKRAQIVTLRWAIEEYRERHQDPLLLRASAVFSQLTAGRYAALRIDADGATPQLLGLRDDGRTAVEIGAMSEGTTDQLFLALRLAAVEQSVAKGVRLPFIADDLFVNFDDERAEAGVRMLAELAKSTQVLFFTHHPHLVEIAKRVVGADLHSECVLV